MRIVALYCLFIIAFSGSSEWKLKKEEAGISIYTRKVEGARMDEFRGIVTIENTTLTEVLDVILDVAGYPSLFPDCTEARILEQDGKYHDIHYIRMKAPWPLKDRDAVYESVTTISDEGKKARVLLKPLTGYADETKNSVRMNKGSGYWDIEEDNQKNVKVIYEFRADPGGDIPAWIANYGTVINPFKTLINLRRRAYEK
jgi:hypothetical protein